MMMKTVLSLGAIAILASCATPASAPSREETLQVVKSSFMDRGIAKLDRLNQSELQQICSDMNLNKKELAKDVRDRLEKQQMATIKYPADGKYLGDWKAGERIAQSGVGKQFSDNPANPNGANCYACHQLTKQEVAYGTIGPSLYNFAKVRGFTPEMQKYAYGKVYNSQAFSACSSMPRFGHSQILTEAQIKDVVALLMDPQSPINQ